MSVARVCTLEDKRGGGPDGSESPRRPVSSTMSPAATDADVRRHLGELHPQSAAWALSCSGYDRDRAADVLQMSYLKVLDGRALYGGRSTLQTWFFSVIRKTAASDRRRRTLHRLLRVGAEPAGAKSKTPLETLEASRRRVEVQKALRTLSRRQREVLELVFYHDLSLSEAAEVMAVSVGSARTHYHRGKRELARKLPHHGAQR